MRPANVFAFVGGVETFRQIVEAFYRGVETDPVLRPMYPEELEESREHLALFLAQFFGGPKTYSESRGHPRLRLRHVPFRIGQAERDAWMLHMRAAIEDAEVAEPARTVMLKYFEDAATFLINHTG
jgi:hemoglobin